MGMNRLAGVIMVPLSMLVSAACSSPAPPPAVLPSGYTPVPTVPAAASVSAMTGLIQPEDLAYLGAFRLPDGPPEFGWAWSGEALAYSPEGDSGGPADGYPGSLFATGHNWNQWVTEVSIPVPVHSPDKNVGDLNMATTLQDFQNIRGGLFDHLDFEIPRAGLEYLPGQGNQETGKLYFCWGQHLQEEGQAPSHGWCELDLSDPQPAGAWYLGDYSNYSTNDYLFAIPQAWAAVHTPGLTLATGRFRDGGWGGQGPSLFAFGPWNEGNPPPPGTRLAARPLLLYDSTSAETSGSHTMAGYSHSDEWSGGAWLSTEQPAGARFAVLFAGTKGIGDSWYGDASGPCLTCNDRGWWSDRFVGQFLFYNPAELAAVVSGEMETWQPQPYATLNIDSYLYHIVSNQQKHHLGAVTFDRDRGLLYILEPLADGDKPLIHVWRIQAPAADLPGVMLATDATTR